MSWSTRALSRFGKQLLSFGLRLAYTGLAFLITLLLARLLGPAALGKYFEVVAWALLIGAATQSGWVPFLVREVAELRERGHVAELMGITWISRLIVGAISVLASILLVVVAYLTGTDAQTMWLVLIAAPIIPLLATSTIRQAVTRGMGWPLLGQICENVTRPGIQLIGLLCFALGLVHRPLDPFAAIVIFLAAIALSAILAAVLERRVTASIRGASSRRIPPVSEWLSSFTRNALIGWSSAINLQIGTIALANAATDPEIADFRIAQQLSSLMAIGLVAASTLAAPEISRCFARKDFAALQALATKTSLFSLGAALPLALLYILFGKPLIGLCFGPQYSGALAPLLILTLGQLANAAFALTIVIAIAARSEAAAVRAHILGAISNILLCIILVPWIGALGAAIGSAASLTLWNVMLFVHVKGRFGISLFGRFERTRPVSWPDSKIESVNTISPDEELDPPSTDH